MRRTRELQAVIDAARRLTRLTGCPVVGGVAVALHGYPRWTSGIDLYAAEPRRVTTAVERFSRSARGGAGRVGVPVCVVDATLFGHRPLRSTALDGVKVVSAADLVWSKLELALQGPDQARHLADVVEVVRLKPLGAGLAARLPSRLRRPYRAIVSVVHNPRRRPMPIFEFWKKYA
jgi:hypothetical protein